MSQSRSVTTNQLGPHEGLANMVKKHQTTKFEKPVADHTRHAFEHFATWFQDQDKGLILDACCGVGDSSRYLANEFPDHAVVGVDRSDDRLSREREDSPRNLLLLRADLMDFYRLLLARDIRPERHYILYPNPYPKAAQLGKRWHASAVFPAIVALGGRLEVRSNWDVYIEEFAAALELYGVRANIDKITPDQPITAFERKYHASGQALWQLVAEL